MPGGEPSCRAADSSLFSAARPEISPKVELELQRIERRQVPPLDRHVVVADRDQPAFAVERDQPRADRDVVAGDGAVVARFGEPAVDGRTLSVSDSSTAVTRTLTGMPSVS